MVSAENTTAESPSVQTSGRTYPYIVKPPDGPAFLESTPRLKVFQIVAEYLAKGWTPDQIKLQHPFLGLAEIHAAFLYYYDHQAVIEQEIERDFAEFDRLRKEAEPSPFVQRLRAAGRLQ